MLENKQNWTQKKGNAPFDPYNLSEIEKIQLDIEKALSFHEPIKTFEIVDSEDITISPLDVDIEITPKSEEPTFTASASSLPDLPDLTYSSHLTTESHDEPRNFESFDNFENLEDLENFETAEKSEATALLRLQDSTTFSPQDTFYKETIKTPTATIPKKVAPKKLKKQFVVTLIVLCTLGTGMLGLGIGFGIAFAQGQQNNLPLTAETPLIMPEPPTLGNTHLTFGNDGTGIATEGSLSDVVRLINPSVVRVSPNLFLDPTNIPDFPGGRINLQNDASGIIFATDDENIYIVTSWHVVNNAETVFVSILDKEAVSARPVGRNTEVDLAIISVSVANILALGITDITIAAFGDSNAMQVGDIVLAIGNAMGEGNSATSGIISATESDVVVQNRTLRLLRTDAAINLGNSGGPLVNKQGEVIGMNTFFPALNMNSQSVEGRGYSIPSNILLPAIEEIMNQTPRPFLGIRGQSVSEREHVAAEFNIPPIGVYVESVIPGTSADIFGILRNDIITGFNGKSILNMDQLIAEIASVNVGDTIEVSILRNQGREQLTLQITLGHDSNNF
ncbi:MAG: S1C family serine protease [Firmicutes bacterium]|nr:S1C family serine protease [Bacillota bacterium]